MISQLTIGKKLMLTAGAVLLAFMGLTSSSVYTAETLGDTLDRSTRNIGESVLIAGELKAAANKLRSNQRGTIMYALAKDASHADATRIDYQRGASEMAQASSKSSRSSSA